MVALEEFARVAFIIKTKAIPMPQLSLEDLARCMEVFKKFDKQDKGSISRSELVEVFGRTYLVCFPAVGSLMFAASCRVGVDFVRRRVH